MIGKVSIGGPGVAVCQSFLHGHGGYRKAKLYSILPVLNVSGFFFVCLFFYCPV